MRRTIGLCVAALLASGSAYATSFTWTAGAASQFYDNSLVWDVGGGAYPRNSSDCMTLNTTGSTLKFRNGSYNWGQITITAGTLNLVGSTNNGSVYKFSADNGATGDLIVSGRTAVISGYLNSPNISTLDVAGNVILTRPGNTNGVWFSANDQHYWNLIMRGGTLGSPKVLDDNQPTHDYWQTVTIAPGAYVTTGTSANGNVSHEVNLVINGTITGGTWYMNAGGGTASVSMGAGGAMTGGKIAVYPQSTMTCLFNTGTYYQIDTSAPGNPGNPARRTFRLKGNVTTTSDFTYNKTTSSYDRDWQDVFTTDNGTGAYYNLTVNGNFTAGGNTNGPATPWKDVFYGFRANSSTITIGGNALFDTYAYVKGGTSQWNFGGNVSFTSAFLFDNTDMSQTTTTINGTGSQSLKFGSKLKLGDFTVNKPSGRATLTDNVLLAGDFRLVSGALAMGSNYLILKGGQNTLPAAETIEIDNAAAAVKRLRIQQGSETWAKLMSNLTVTDNLDVDAGCKLFLNGFNLYAATSDLKQNFVNFSGTFTTREGGEIVGAGEIPEPATLLLVGTGLLVAVGYARRRRMH